MEVQFVECSSHFIAIHGAMLMFCIFCLIRSKPSSKDIRKELQASPSLMFSMCWYLQVLILRLGNWLMFRFIVLMLAAQRTQTLHGCYCVFGDTTFAVLHDNVVFPLLWSSFFFFHCTYPLMTFKFRMPKPPHFKRVPTLSELTPRCVLWDCKYYSLSPSIPNC